MINSMYDCFAQMSLRTWQHYSIAAKTSHSKSTCRPVSSKNVLQEVHQIIKLLEKSLFRMAKHTLGSAHIYFYLYHNYTHEKWRIAFFRCFAALRCAETDPKK